MVPGGAVHHHQRIIGIAFVLSCRYKLAVDGETFVVQKRTRKIPGVEEGGGAAAAISAAEV